MAQVNNFINLSTSGQIAGSAGIVLEGMYVNSTSSGAIKLWHGTTYSDVGIPIAGTITPAVGYHFLGNLDASAGVYVQGVAGTWNITFRFKLRD